MRYEQLLKIEKPFFSHEDVANVLDIQPESAAVLCSRYVKKGLLTRLKRGLYARTETLRHMRQEDLFRIANFLQVPSYISLMTALSYYGISTQIQRGFFESISLKRTRTFDINEQHFSFIKIKPQLYREFVRRENIFIALPEKALLDSFYLASMGRYALDIHSLDVEKVDERALRDLSTIFPPKTIKYFEKQYAKITRS